MAAEKENMLKLKVLVDKKQNRVVFVESDGDFVNTLFSFLTMPIGTILRLTLKQSETAILGSMGTLYQSLENLEADYFEKETTKALLLRPRNPYDYRCKDLKLNVDDTEATRYYGCNDMYEEEFFSDKHSASLSTSQLFRCSCGKLMDQKIQFTAINDGVFIQGRMFIVTDNLKVIQQSTKPSWALLKDLGIKEVASLEEENINLGVKEILSLLQLSFISTTPLTDVLLKGVDHTYAARKMEQEETHYILKSEDVLSSDTKKITVKLNIRKSNNTVLYAEAGEDFVDFIFSLLTIPLGSVLRLLVQTPKLGCLTNLYKSVESSCSTYKEHLLSPPVAPQFGCKNQPLDIEVMHHPRYYKGDKLPVNKNENWKANAVVNPNPSEVFLKAPETFMVTDDLIVTPFSFISSLFLLNKLKVPIDDMMIREMSIGQEEALRLLEACLTSKSVLTTAFKFKEVNLKKPKQET